jgi:two-component system cell cycle response regulator
MAREDWWDSTGEVTVMSDRDVLLKKTQATGQAMLIVLGGTRLGQRAVLDCDEFVIGRASGAGLVLDGDAVSRIHARIVRRNGAYFLADAGSTNGSFVNYARVVERELVDGDEIQIGHNLLKFLAGDNIETACHEEYRRLIRRDALTGVLNRSAFDEELENVLRASAKSTAPLCLILVDIDHFKRINDGVGHTAGDVVLRAVSSKLDALTPLPHLCARVGGEEFGIVFLGDLDQALAHADLLRTAVEELVVEYEERKIGVTMSCGVARAESLSTPAALYERADRLLYVAKEAGRNCVRPSTVHPVL